MVKKSKRARRCPFVFAAIEPEEVQFSPRTRGNARHDPPSNSQPNDGSMLNRAPAASKQLR